MAEELHRALTLLAERGETRGADTVLASARRAAHPGFESRPTWRRGLVPAVGAALVVLVFVGLVLWVVHPLGGQESAIINQPDAPVTTPAAPVPDEVDDTLDSTETSVADIPAEPITWASAPLPAELHDIQLLDGSFVAISTVSGPAGVFGEAVVSSNGLDWEPLRSQPAWAGEVSASQIEREGLAYPVALVEHGGDLFTVTDFTSSRMPVVERLTDSTGDWIAVPIEEVPGVNNNEIRFAAGNAGMIMFAGSTEGEALLWVLTVDGFELTDDPLISALPVADADVPWTDAVLAGYLRSSKLLATGEGFVAEFWVANDQGVTSDSSLRYRSADGRTWIEGQATDRDFGDFEDYAESGRRILGIGLDGAWISDDDGTTWEQTQRPDQLIADTVAGGAFGWVVPAGQVAFGDLDGIKLSVDGVEWETVLDLDAWVTSLVIKNNTIVIGAVSGGWNDDPYIYEVWVGTVNSEPAD